MKGQDYEYVIPRSTILIENPVAVRRHVRGQARHAQGGRSLRRVPDARPRRSARSRSTGCVRSRRRWQPRRPRASRRSTDLFTIRDLGDWAAVQKAIFDKGAAYDAALLAAQEAVTMSGVGLRARAGTGPAFGHVRRSRSTSCCWSPCRSRRSCTRLRAGAGRAPRDRAAAGRPAGALADDLDGDRDRHRERRARHRHRLGARALSLPGTAGPVRARRPAVRDPDAGRRHDARRCCTARAALLGDTFSACGHRADLRAARRSCWRCCS